jgi:DNA-binding XRE family transcriptional regulator
MSLEIAERIKVARKAKGWSQDTLAKEIGVSKGNVSRWESGEHNPERSNLEALAEALDVVESWLAGYGERDPIRRAHTGDSPDASLMAGAMLDWVAASQVAKLLIRCPEAQGLTESQMAGAFKRLYVVAVRDPSKLTDALVAGMALSHS